LLVPLQGAVIREEDKKRFPSVNQTVTSSIVSFYIFFAITCWAAFGDNMKTALTASLPPGPFSTIAQLAYSIAVIFSFPLQAFPALEVVFQHSSGVRTDPSKAMKLNLLSSLMICFLGAVAYMAIDYLGNVVSLLGSLVGIPIALIYPPLMHNILVRDGSRTTKRMNNLVATVGFLAMATTSYTTITQWGDMGEE
jgi:proton-coupled amino acid transporter